MSHRISRPLIAIAAATLMVGASATAAVASDDELITRGSCTMRSDWKLKAKTEDGNRLEIEFEVDSNRVGQTWNVTITDNGVRVFAGTRKTLAPSGSFSVERNVLNRAGTDRFRAVATHAASGERCVGTLAYPR